jgi:hypothetical protein
VIGRYITKSYTFRFQDEICSFGCRLDLYFFTMSAEHPSHCKVVLAGTIAKPLLAEVLEGVKKLEKAPLLVGFLSSSDPGGRVYAEWTGRTCREK